MIGFEWVYLLALAPLPLLVRRLAPRARHEGESALRVPFFARLAALGGAEEKGPARRRLRWLGILIWMLLVTAAARPQWQGEPVALPLQGRDLMLAVDVSGSMGQPGMDDGRRTRATRLDQVKRAAVDFLERREGDRVGLILFGTRAYLQTPLTFDRQAVAARMAESVVGIAGQNTALGDAVGLAVKRLRDRPAESRVLVLLTDGRNTAGSADPREAARLAKRAGLTIYAIGVGPAPGLGISGFGLFSRSDLDEETLKAMAKTTGGLYFHAGDREGLEKAYRKLDELEPVESDARFFRPRKALFFWFLGTAFLLSLLLAALALGRRGLLPSANGLEREG